LAAEQTFEMFRYILFGLSVLVLLLIVVYILTSPKVERKVKSSSAK
jgi:hypothetical protein